MLCRPGTGSFTSQSSRSAAADNQTNTTPAARALRWPARWPSALKPNDSRAAIERLDALRCVSRQPALTSNIPSAGTRAAKVGERAVPVRLARREQSK